MKRRMLPIGIAAAVLAAALSTSVRAQAGDPAEQPRKGSEQAEPAKKKARTRTDGAPTKPKPPRPTDTVQPAIRDVQSELEGSGQPAAATIERIMDQAVRNISARYNLNDAQKAETRALMHREVLRFIKEHENEVWPAVRDLLASNLGARPPSDAQEISRIGKAARPLARLAKEAIFRANEEWGLILNAEQKKMHDFDMAEMEDTFQKIDQNFADWEAGRATEQGIFPQPHLTGREPPRPKKPPEGLPEPEIEIFNPANVFEALVEKFIKDYELTEGQITSARSILEEFKNKANDFRAANKEEFAKNDADQQEARRNRDLAAIKKADAERKKLLGPVYELVDLMEHRLMALLDTAQIQRFEDKKKEAAEAKAAKEARRTEPPPQSEKDAAPKTETPAKKPPDGEAAKSDSRGS